MRHLTLAAILLGATAMTTPAFAGDSMISEEPVELTVHMHHKRYTLSLIHI